MVDAPDRGSLTAELIASGLFDADWYLQRNDDVARAGKDALEHFAEFGWAEGRWPNRYFDPAWYRTENADVVEAGVDPLLHYMRDGDREGRRPHPLFDPVWYRSAYCVAGLALGHYLVNRLGGQFVPGPNLFAVPLIAPYRDDAERGIDPVAHYLDDTEAAGQEAFPDPGVVRAARLLDENYYLINGTDVHEADVDPTDHFCRFGWRENRKPNIYFDLDWYEQTNPDVSRLKINPLVHYILVGEAAGRRPVPFFEPAWYRMEYAVPEGQLALSHYMANRRKQTVSPTPLFDIKWYMQRFGADLGPNRDPFTHYLQAGTLRDIDPSAQFDAANYRRTHLGRPTKRFPRLLKPDLHNPLVHYLRAEYAARDRGA